MFNVEEIRKEFPILERKVNNNKLCYLDNSASAQKPRVVIEELKSFYQNEYSNVHRGLHLLSNMATDKFENVRNKIGKFLGAKSAEEIVFTSGSTEGLNLIAFGWAEKNLKRGDEIIISVMEHHANIVPWHFLRKKIGIVIKWVEPNKDGSLPSDSVIENITEKTKLISLTQMSNVFGSIVDVKTICKIAHKKNIPVVIDGSQAAVHMKINVSDIDCDFYVVTGHKLYGPSSSGTVFIKKERMKEMQPFMGGGSMIKSVQREMVEYNSFPHMFEAGTPNISEIIGLGKAIDFISDLGLDNIANYELKLKNYCVDEFKKLSWLNIQGTHKNKGCIFSFTIDGNGHPHDISTLLDSKGIAVRAGHHCCQPLMDHLGLSATCRASFALYNTEEEVSKLLNGLKFCHEIFN